MIRRSTPQVLNMRQVLGPVTATYGVMEFSGSPRVCFILQNETLAAQVIQELALANNPYFSDRGNVAIIRHFEEGKLLYIALGIKLTVIERYLGGSQSTPVRGTVVVVWHSGPGTVGANR